MLGSGFSVWELQFGIFLPQKRTPHNTILRLFAKCLQGGRGISVIRSVEFLFSVTDK